jgi:hypothetical protein
LLALLVLTKKNFRNYCCVVGSCVGALVEVLLVVVVLVLVVFVMVVVAVVVFLVVVIAGNRQVTTAVNLSKFVQVFNQSSFNPHPANVENMVSC